MTTRVTEASWLGIARMRTGVRITEAPFGTCGLLVLLVLAASLTLPTEARADESDAASAPAAVDPPLSRLTAASLVAASRIASFRGIGLDVVGGVRARPVLGAVGSETDATLSVQRREGRLSITASATLSRATGTREDTDAQGDVTAAVALPGGFYAGAEGRVRGEVIDGITASDDVGRPVEVLAGGLAGLRLGAVTLQSFAGVGWPRGPLPAGPAVLSGVSFSF